VADVALEKYREQQRIESEIEREEGPEHEVKLTRCQAIVVDLALQQHKQAVAQANANRDAALALVLEEHGHKFSIEKLPVVMCEKRRDGTYLGWDTPARQEGA